MILIPVKEEFDDLLLEAGEIASRLESRRYSFIDDAKLYIEKLEKRAEKYRIPFASELGILRSKLNVIDEVGDIRANGGCNPENRKSYRKKREAFVLARLEEACRRVREYFAASDASFNEALNLCRQAAAIAQTKGLLPRLDAEQRSGKIREIWEALRMDSDLCSLCTHVIGMVGIYNTLVLFDRAIIEISM